MNGNLNRRKGNLKGGPGVLFGSDELKNVESLVDVIRKQNGDSVGSNGAGKLLDRLSFDEGVIRKIESLFTAIEENNVKVVAAKSYEKTRMAIPGQLLLAMTNHSQMPRVIGEIIKHGGYEPTSPEYVEASALLRDYGDDNITPGKINANLLSYLRKYFRD